MHTISLLPLLRLHGKLTAVVYNSLRSLQTHCSLVAMLFLYFYLFLTFPLNPTPSLYSQGLWFDFWFMFICFIEWDRFWMSIYGFFAMGGWVKQLLDCRTPGGSQLLKIAPTLDSGIAVKAVFYCGLQAKKYFF